MNTKKICKQTEKHGIILCLSGEDKKQLEKAGFKVEEIETPCGSNGFQAVSKRGIND